MPTPAPLQSHLQFCNTLHKKKINFFFQIIQEKNTSSFLKCVMSVTIDFIDIHNFMRRYHLIEQYQLVCLIHFICWCVNPVKHSHLVIRICLSQYWKIVYINNFWWIADFLCKHFLFFLIHQIEFSQTDFILGFLWKSL